MNIEIQPYFAEGERYPALIGVRVEGDEYQMAYVSKVELADALTDNAKLRELVRDYERCSVHADCGLCEYDGKLSTHCPLSPCFPDAHELRELGIEVDDA